MEHLAQVVAAEADDDEIERAPRRGRSALTQLETTLYRRSLAE